MKALGSFACVLLASGCDPEATALCETRVECGQVVDVDTCLMELRTERDLAAQRFCDDEYYAVVNCQLGLELTCESDLARVTAQSCWEEKCRYTMCGGGGFPTGPELPDPCEQSFEATGTWKLQITTASCYQLTPLREIVVQRTGDAYVMSAGGATVTGTIETSPGGAAMNATITAGGETLTVDVFAFARAVPYSNFADIMGKGRGTIAGCTADVTIFGEVKLAPTGPSP